MTELLEREVVEPQRFSLARNPFYRLLRKLRLTSADGRPRVWGIVSIAWLPLCIGALVRVAIHDAPAPILFDISVHVRMLVAIPLLFTAEKLLEQRCRGAIKQLYDGRLAPRASIDHILNRAERARDSRVAELLILVLALAVGQAGLWNVGGPTGLFAGVDEPGGISFARIWYVTVSLPLVQFLVMRWLWHWCTWSYVVVRVARLPLHTIASHPDHAAGIGFMSSPVTAFSGFVLAISSTIAGAWGTQILHGHATVKTFIPTFLALVVVMVVLACGPLLAYMSLLYRARHREIGAYNRLALELVRKFHHTWIDELAQADELLGWPDFGPMHDLMGTYESIVKVRLVPFGPRPVIAIWAAAVAPMLPLVATTMPLHELFMHVGRALLGGL